MDMASKQKTVPFILLIISKETECKKNVAPTNNEMKIEKKRIVVSIKIECLCFWNMTKELICRRP